jgi:cytidine deaminase
MTTNDSQKEPRSNELIFGLVAPIGVNLELTTDVLAQSLKEFQYETQVVRVTTLMKQMEIGLPFDGPNHIDQIKCRIEYANKVRRELKNDALAVLAVSAIRQLRKLGNLEILMKAGKKPDESGYYEEQFLNNQAFVIRQLKRPEEVETLRRIYGDRFVLIGVNAPLDARKRHITDAQNKSLGGLVAHVVIESMVNELIAQDSIEAREKHGQKVRDAYPLADVFIDATTRATCEETLRRFIRLFFGNNGITPSRDEYGMYIAKSASLRSGDLSRQIGAAIFSKTGEVVTLGSNEVPKAGGGTYWPDSASDGRDFARGFDPNERLAREIFVDLLDRMKKNDALSPNKYPQQMDTVEIAADLLKNENPTTAIKESRVMDIIEFGRIIHAEMSALSDAARKGLAVQDGTLFSTAFPCHLCAKHIVAAGIRRVVFLEPYPKSYAWKLHDDSIAIDQKDCGGKVSFESFLGISPVRYRNLFEKKTRKVNGDASPWWKGKPEPMIEMLYPTYEKKELYFLNNLAKLLKAKNWQLPAQAS